MCHPAADSGHGESGGKQLSRDPDAVQQGRCVELDVRLQLAIGLVFRQHVDCNLFEVSNRLEDALV